MVANPKEKKAAEKGEKQRDTDQNIKQKKVPPRVPVSIKT